MIKSTLIVPSSGLLAIITLKPSSPRKKLFSPTPIIPAFQVSPNQCHMYTDSLHMILPAIITLESALPKSDYQIIPLTSDLGLVSAFLMCVILHGKTSEVTLLCSLFQEAMHHRRRHACVAVGVGMIIVNRLVDLETQLRVMITSMVVSCMR